MNNQTQAVDLKSYITQHNVSIRFAYERIQDTFPKLCNLVGTSMNTLS